MNHLRVVRFDVPTARVLRGCDAPTPAEPPRDPCASIVPIMACVLCVIGLCSLGAFVAAMSA